jgi:ketosteroid isomerase-like protein
MTKLYTAPEIAKASSESQRILVKAPRNIAGSAAIRLRQSDSTYTSHLQRAALRTGAKFSDFFPLSRLVRERRASRKIRVSLTLVAIMLTQSVAGSACAQTSAALDQEAWQIAEVMANKFQTAYNVGDVAAIANLFVDNAYYFTPGGTVLYGWDRQAIQRAFAARIRAGWTKEVVKITEAHSAGEAVWVTGEYVISGTGENQGKQIDGYFAQVITRSGREWRFRIVIANLKPKQDVTGMSEVKGVAKPP